MGKITNVNSGGDIAGYHMTPTGVATPGEVYSMTTSFQATSGVLAYLSDSTATGATSGDLGIFTAFERGTHQIVFDPPMQFGKGLMWNVAASGTSGYVTFHWSELSPNIGYRRKP